MAADGVLRLTRDSCAFETTSPAAWGQTVSESFLGLNFEGHSAGAFHASIRVQQESGIRFADVGATGHRGTRNSAEIADGSRNYVFISLRNGAAAFSQEGRTAELEPGDCVVYDSTLPFIAEVPRRFMTQMISFPKSLAGIPGRQVEELFARPIRSSVPLASAVSTALESLSPHLRTLSASSRSRALDGAVALISALLFEQLGISPDESARGARFEQLTKYIETHLGDADLGPRRLAAEHFVSLRLVHHIFAEQGTTVGGWIRERRLERIRRELALPELRSTPVLTIAERTGVRNASYLNKLFRERYGETPARYRRRLLG